MKTRNFTSVGALHPVLFFAVMYIVVLFFSIFICSSLFYSCSANPAENLTGKKEAPVKQQRESAVQVSAAIVVR